VGGGFYGDRKVQIFSLLLSLTEYQTAYQLQIDVIADDLAFAGMPALNSFHSRFKQGALIRTPIIQDVPSS
jgi:hypothetical protein